MFSIAHPEPTPVPPTATPVPYNLTVKVLTAEGQPVELAQVSVGNETIITGAQGSVDFPGLPGAKAKVKITAPGYFANSMDEDLNAGDNTLEVELEEDPAGLLAANACSAGESLLYIDDFQDQSGEGWDQLDAGGPGWTIEPDPQNPDNFVMAARGGTSWNWLGGRDTYKFDNAVWRIKFKLAGNGNMHFNFRFTETTQQSIRYILAAGDGALNLGRLDNSGNHVELGIVDVPYLDRWHLLEFAYFGSQVTVFVDGAEAISWKEPNPWDGGTVNIEPYAGGDAVFYYDDISVCGLSAAVQPIPKPKTGRNLNVNITDEEGNRVQGAMITIMELGGAEDGQKIVDEEGFAAWSDLPGSSVTVVVNAPGYFSVEDIVSIQKGDTEKSFLVKRDANSKLISEICQPEETLVYYEDIQDKAMQDWPTITNSIAMGAPAMAIVEDSDQAGNMMLQLVRVGESSNTGDVMLSKGPFSDAVFRFRARATGNVHYLIGWHNNFEYQFNGQPADHAQYVAFIYANQDAGGRVEKVVNMGGNRTGVVVINWQRYLRDGKWHDFELSTYQGEYQLWIDGKLAGKWLDPNPIPDGFLSIANDFWKADASAIYDDFTVCRLEAPFASLYAAK